MSDHHQYGLPDLRQLMAGRTHLQPSPQPTAESITFFQSRNNNLAPQIAHHHHIYHHDYGTAAAANEVMFPSGLVKLGHDRYCTNVTSINPTTAATAAATTSAAASNATASFVSGTGATFFGLDMESGWIGNDAGNNSRWPRQETLTLLEIRSRLDSRFREANQKGPLWDEVSRIMADEHGYQRSGKKCREKFENLYKYYKKTKDGKAGRQDGKHYRFFRQLEALYGETSNQIASASETTHLTNTNTTFLYQPPSNNINQENQESFQETNNKHSEQSLSFSNTSEFETSSSENNDEDLSAIAYMMKRSMEKQKGLSTESQSYTCTKAKKNWKGKVKNFVDIQMKKLLESQEAWMERMIKTIEDREQERMFREEEWTKQESARLDRIHEFWAKERAWMEARDVALMEILRKCTGKGLDLSSSIEKIAIATQNHYNNQDRNAKKIGIDHEVLKASRWSEPEIFSLIQIRTTMESRFQESSNSGYSKENLWEEIAGKMANLGYDRGVDECKEKWKNMNVFFNMATEGEGFKKRKEDLTTSNYFQQLDPYNGQEIARLEGMNSSSSPTSNSYMGSDQMHGSCFQVPANGGGEQLWNKYGLKPRKEKNQQL
ncbi:trihelix transcription factor PTL [Ricinus communis]|uniref:trihelix transcription factor PTL n=1 Tax=Ricinus communis TaxID=3988 RepID=UPI000772AF4E|nr:trihelix transcription factor PTL [Ricinus communis]|eukprot:XP_015581905.1 trihelix transcription factor PTL [Ricinus communis]